MEWSGEASGDAAEHRSGGDGEGGGTTSYDREEFYAVRSESVGGIGAVGEYAGTHVYVLWAARTLIDGVCGEVGE